MVVKLVGFLCVVVKADSMRDVESTDLNTSEVFTWLSLRVQYCSSLVPEPPPPSQNCFKRSSIDEARELDRIESLCVAGRWANSVHGGCNCRKR